MIICHTVGLSISAKKGCDAVKCGDGNLMPIKKALKWSTRRDRGGEHSVERDNGEGVTGRSGIRMSLGT